MASWYCSLMPRKYPRKRFYRVRTSRHPWSHGDRVFICARGYRDALWLQKQYGGRIVGGGR